MNRIVLVSLSLVLLVCVGCFGVLSRAIVPDVNPKKTDEELAHIKGIYDKSNSTLLSLINAQRDVTLEDGTVLAAEDKHTRQILRILDRMNKRANDISPSALQTAGSQYMAMLGQNKVEAGLKEGFEVTKGLLGVGITSLLGVGGAGAVGTRLLGRKKKRMMETENKIYKETVNENNLTAAAREKAKHTEVDGVIG